MRACVLLFANPLSIVYLESYLWDNQGMFSGRADRTASR